MYVPLTHRWVLSRQQLMPPFVRCKRVRNASAAAPCLLAVDRGNGIHIAGHRNRHGTGFCAQLPLTHGPASTCNTGHLFAQEVAFKTNVSIAHGDTNWDWFKRMELGSKVWGNLLANSSGFLSDTTWRPKQHLAPPFDTAPVNRPLLESAVKRFPEWRGCWGCVHNDSDTHCCSGRGDCRMGLCMCRDGAFGMDCAHEAEARSTQAGTALEPAPAEAATQGLRIYVHEMPFELGQTWLASVARLTAPGARCVHTYDAVVHTL